MVTSTQSTYYYTTTTSNFYSSMGPTATDTAIYYEFFNFYARDSTAARKRKKLINEIRAMLMPAGELFEM